MLEAATSRVLALDVGSVRVGLAVSDPFGSFAQPYQVWPRHLPDWGGRLAALAQQLPAGLLVVGRPLRLDGSAGPAVAQVERFVEILRPALAIPIIWWDERLSTAGVQRDMVQAGVRRSQRRERIDKVAAAWILQSYLDARRCRADGAGAEGIGDTGRG